MTLSLAAVRVERPGPRALFGEPLLLTLLLLVGLMLFVWPLLAVLRLAFFGAEGGVGALVEALDSRSVRRALWHSVESSALSALIATVTGAALALLVGVTDLRSRVALSFVILLPMMIPAHVITIAWMQTLGPSSVLAGLLGLPVTPGATHPLYSREGVIALLALQQMPLVFLTFRAALRTLPRDLAEAARVAGAGPARLLWRIVLPLLRPALVAGFALAFVSALGNFGIPALLGVPGRYVTLPVLMWQRLASSGPSVLTDVAVLAVPIGVLAAIALPVQLALQRRLSVALTGAAQATLRLSLGRARPWVEAGLWLMLAGLVLVPLLSMVATALLPTWGVALTLETVTLDQFREVLFRQDVTLRALANSTCLAIAAGGIVAILALGLAPFLRRGDGAGRAVRGMAMLAELCYALPGLVISVAFIIVFLRPLPGLGLSIYGTHVIILGAYLSAFLAVALKPVGVARDALDPALSDAARVAGAGFWRRLARIEAPLLAPAAASGAVLVALVAFSEVTLSSILWTRGTETLGTVIFNYEDGGYTGLAAAMSVLAVAATLALMLALDRLGRHLPPGIVPWRG